MFYPNSNLISCIQNYHRLERWPQTLINIKSGYKTHFLINDNE